MELKHVSPLLMQKLPLAALLFLHTCCTCSGRSSGSVMPFGAALSNQGRQPTPSSDRYTPAAHALGCPLAPACPQVQCHRGEQRPAAPESSLVTGTAALPGCLLAALRHHILIIECFGSWQIQLAAAAQRVVAEREWACCPAWLAPCGSAAVARPSLSMMMCCNMSAGRCI